MNFKDVEIGDIFSESSHYIVKEVQKNDILFTHTESKNQVLLSKKYVEDLLVTADQYDKEVKVGKEDKLWTAKQVADAIAKNESYNEAGTVRVSGIKNIWLGISSSKVFTVCFKKADKALSAKRYKELKELQIKTALEAVEKAQKNKTGVLEEAKAQLQALQNSPVLDYEKGELRELRGYKTQFVSEDGRFDCMDMDLMEIRPVNINTIQWLVVDNVKYIVE